MIIRAFTRKSLKNACLSAIRFTLRDILRVSSLEKQRFVVRYNTLSLYIEAEGRDSSVGIATRYGLDDRRIESCCGQDLSHSSRPAQEPTPTPTQWVPGLFPGGKAAGARC
jgi:hypothetical protein